jgi:ResB-like family
MEQTAIKSGAPPNPPSSMSTAITANPERLRPLGKDKSLPLRCLEVVASLRVTVVLFTLSIILVYYGTWAQKEAGIWTVVNQYFRSALVWIPLKIVFMHAIEIGGSIPFPGGWFLGTLLLINLLAAHAVRFKMTWKRSGILLIHSGLIVMMLGELITGLYAIEGHMFIMESTQTNWVEHDRTPELAIVDRSDPKADKEFIVPVGRLKQAALAIDGKPTDGGGVIQDDKLPFDVEVVDFMFNTDWAEPNDKNPATTGIGLRRTAKPRPETTGVDQEQRIESQSAYVTLKEKGTGKSLGTFLVSTWFSYLQRPMEEVVVNGKRYGIALRMERDYRDYAIQLIEFRHDKYVGTEIAKNFSSAVRITDLDNPDKDGRKVLIKMNHPLFYQGETFYQANLHPLTTGTVLQVVRNPGWWMPYISCVLVTFGMMVHFGLHLFSFLQRRLAA